MLNRGKTRRNCALRCVALGTRSTRYAHMIVGMRPRSNPSAARQWCHVVCTIHRRRERFNIPTSARFCERAIIDACSLPGWSVDTVVVAPTQIRVLVRAPPRMTRQMVIRAVQRAAGGAVRRAGGLSRMHYRVWGGRAWCFVLRNAAAVRAVRLHMMAAQPPGPQPSRLIVGPVRWPIPVGQ